MAIDITQSLNVMQSQQLGLQKVRVEESQHYGRLAPDSAGNEDQLAQEIQTIKQATQTPSSTQENVFSDRDEAQEDAIEQSVQVSEEQNKKNNKKIHDAILEMNKRLNANTESVFGIHEKTDRVTIKIVDKDSKKVIKEFPPEKTLDLIAKVWEIAGIAVDEKK